MTKLQKIIKELQSLKIDVGENFNNKENYIILLEYRYNYNFIKKNYIDYVIEYNQKEKKLRVFEKNYYPRLQISIINTNLTDYKNIDLSINPKISTLLKNKIEKKLKGLKDVNSFEYWVKNVYVFETDDNYGNTGQKDFYVGYGKRFKKAINDVTKKDSPFFAVMNLIENNASYIFDRYSKPKNMKPKNEQQAKEMAYELYKQGIMTNIE